MEQSQNEIRSPLKSYGNINKTPKRNSKLAHSMIISNDKQKSNENNKKAKNLNITKLLDDDQLELSVHIKENSTLKVV